MQKYEKPLEHSEVMMQIGRELMEVMELNYDCEEKAKLLEEIEKLKQHHNTEMQSLKLKMHLSESTYAFNLQQSKNKYDEILHERDCFAYENEKLKEEIVRNRNEMEAMQAICQKHKEKIKNQETLIDEYKKSIDEQIGLEKEVIKSSFMERELNQKLKFEKALKSMENNFERKISEIKNETAFQDYRNDVKSIKKFCSTLNKKRNKISLVDAFAAENNKENTSNSLKKIVGCSSYSTLDR